MTVTAPWGRPHKGHLDSYKAAGSTLKCGSFQEGVRQPYPEGGEHRGPENRRWGRGQEVVRAEPLSGHSPWGRCSSYRRLLCPRLRLLAFYMAPVTLAAAAKPPPATQMTSLWSQPSLQVSFPGYLGPEYRGSTQFLVALVSATSGFPGRDGVGRQHTWQERNQDSCNPLESVGAVSYNDGNGPLSKMRAEASLPVLSLQVTW